ncbi:MAG: AraC family transcriptional regulator [Myxococcota bacterium]
MSVTSSTVSAQYLGELFEFAIERGAHRERLEVRAGVRASDLDDPDARLPLERYMTLMRVAKDLCGDPALALRLGSRRDFKHVSVVGLLCFASPTMGDALAALNRYGRLVADVDAPDRDEQFQIVERGDHMWLVDTRLRPDDFPEFTEETWARFATENRRNFPDRTFASAAHVTHPRPSYHAFYESTIGAPVTYNAEWNALCLPRSWLSIPLHEPNAYVFGVLSKHAQQLLEELKASETFRAKVEALLLPSLHDGTRRVEEVASQLGMSRQTVYRKLLEESTTYENVLDELRHRMALYYLEGGRTTIAETACLVGFSEPSAFSRAFKRWTGRSPKTLAGKKR